VYSIANSCMTAFKANPGANTARLSINPPGVSRSWWSAHRGAADAALADRMKVIIGETGYNDHVAGVGVASAHSPWPR
jgi:hypothetical protein